MVQTETIEGTIDGGLWFHYDVTADVLYLRQSPHRLTETVGEETDDGFILLRDSHSDAPVGITIINWWKRFGSGTLPDSVLGLAQLISPWGRRVAA